MNLPIATPITLSRVEARTAIERYLFRTGGVYNIAICRIALFDYLYIHVLGEAKSFMGAGVSEYYTRVNVAAYYPKSLVWFLFPSAPPPAGFVDLVLLAASVATVLALVGFLTRVAMVVSVLCLVFLASLIFSWEPLWSHPYNSGLIAGLIFMFGRAGDALSIDSLLTRLRGRPPQLNRDVYWWPVIAGQFGVAAVYFGGFYAKWSTPDFTYDLSWVLSDNLRNSVVLPWLIRGQEFPWNVDLIVNNSFIWKLSAAGHLATQALPMLALFSLGRPWIRLLEGLIFVAGVVLLKFTMGMWNPSWIILATFFVDWEFFLAKAGFRFRRPAPLLASEPRRRAWVTTFFLAFATLNLAIITLRLDDSGWNRLYPFSSMNFYSDVMARKPYTEHSHYPFNYGEVIFHYADGIGRAWHCYSPRSNNYLVAFSNGPDASAKVTQQVSAMSAILGTLKSFKGDTFKDCVGTVHRGADSIDIYASILHIPPYPERAKFEVGHRALVSRYERRKDRIIAASAGMANISGGGLSFTVASEGLDVERYEILVRNDPWANYRLGPLVETNGTWNGNVYTMDKAALDALPTGWLPYVVRVHEGDGSTYDFFAGIIYR